MKLYVVYTASHAKLYHEWFLPSLKDPFDLRVCEMDEQFSTTGNYMSEGWIKTMQVKVDLILNAIRENPGKIFFHSDVDVVFFKPIQNELEQFMRGSDMAVMRDSQEGHLCAGFFAGRGNERMLKLWSAIRENLVPGASMHDQHWLNEFLLRRGNFISAKLKGMASRILSWGLFPRHAANPLLSNPFGVRWRYLPDSYRCPRGTFWQPNEPLDVPQNIAVHHANWTVGIENKIAQLQYVCDVVEKRKKTPREIKS